MDTILLGEVIAGFPPSHEENTNKVRWEYTVKAITKFGNTGYYPRAILMESTSGINDFSQRSVRTSGGQSTSAYEVPLAPDAQRLTTGDRCLISFIEGDENRPIILGFIAHPQSIAEVDDDEPQLHTRYNGMDFRIDPEGQFIVTHYGLTEIEQEAPFTDIKLTEPDPVNTTSVQFLNDGIFKLIDSAAQELEVNPLDKYISLNNTAEEIYISGPDKLIEFSTTGNLEEVIQVDRICYIGERNVIAVGSDFITSISGKSITTIDDSCLFNVGNTFTSTVTGNYTLNVQDGNVNINTKSGHLMFFDDTAGKEAIFLIHKLGAQIALDKKGSIKIIAKDGSYFFVDADTGTITLTSKDGSLISIKDKITIADKTGKQTISMRDGNIDINSGTNVTISAVNANINSGSVTLGAQAVLSAALAEKIMLLFNTHLHPTAVGPSGPPVIPWTASGQLADPFNIASGSVKLKA
jgi:hypothetical protein